jgi:predicted CopG family antitoxin
MWVEHKIRNQALTARQLLEDLPQTTTSRPSLIVGGIMGQEEKRITYALPKHLKTMEAMWEGFHIASGRSYLGFDVTQGKVLYIGLEGTLVKLRARIIKMMENFPGESWDSFSFAILKPGERNVERIEELINEHKPDLTIVDPLTSLLKKEDKKEDVEGLLNELDRLIGTHHTAIHVIHHARKSKGPVETLENMRGSTALPGWADCICRVSRVNNNKDKIKLSWETRYGEEDLGDIVLAFDRENCSFSEVIEKMSEIRVDIMRMLAEARARGERLYVSQAKEGLEDKASERTIEKAINSLEGIAVRIDETDRRKRYLEWVEAPTEEHTSVE